MQRLTGDSDSEALHIRACTPTVLEGMFDAPS